jgi:ATP-binding cassette, subfamily B, bacterial MsbA
LDSESERLVQEAIERLLSGRTVFVIAHRLSTVQKADRILVMDAGKVVQEGSHLELLAEGGLYRRLHELQFVLEADGARPGKLGDAGQDQDQAQAQDPARDPGSSSSQVPAP